MVEIQTNTFPKNLIQRIKIASRNFGRIWADSPLPYGEQWQKNRANEIIEKTGIQKYLENEGRYLDVGCGKGHIPALMQPSGTIFEIDAYDFPTPKMLKVLAQKQGSPNFAFADAAHLPYKDNSFTGVSLFFVLHHLGKEYQMRALEEAKRIAQQYIFIAEDTVDLNNAAQTQTALKVDKKLNPHLLLLGEDHHDFKSESEWEAIFQELQLRVVKKTNFGVNKTDQVPHTFYVLK